MLKIYFGDSEAFKTQSNALNYAESLSKEFSYLEYGISMLVGQYENF